MMNMKREPQTMDCRNFRHELENSVAALTPTLLGDDSRAHAAACDACAAHWREHLSLHHLLRSLDAITPPADFDVRLYARLDARKRKQRSVLSDIRRMWLPNLSTPTSLAKAATCCLSLVFLIVILHSSSSMLPQNPLSPKQDNEEFAASQSDALLLAPATSNIPRTAPDNVIPPVNKASNVAAQSSPTPRNHIKNNLSERHRANAKQGAQMASRSSRPSYAEAAASTRIERNQRARGVMRLRDATVSVSSRMMEATLRDGRRAGQAVVLNAVSFGDDTCRTPRNLQAPILNKVYGENFRFRSTRVENNRTPLRRACRARVCGRRFADADFRRI
jgi:hypothetical protein